MADLLVELPDDRPGPGAVAVGVEVPDLGRGGGDDVDDGFVVPCALAQQGGGAAQHAPAGQVEAELQAGHLQVLRGGDVGGAVLLAEGSEVVEAVVEGGVPGIRPQVTGERSQVRLDVHRVLRSPAPPRRTLPGAGAYGHGYRRDRPVSGNPYCRAVRLLETAASLRISTMISGISSITGHSGRVTVVCLELVQVVQE